MKGFRFLKKAALSLACVGILLPQADVQASSGPFKTVARESVDTASQVIDVKLGENGILRGQVVNSQGKALEGTPVTIMQGRKEVVRTVTGKNGEFAVKNLRGGLHQIVSANGVGLYRFWAEKAAPPQSREQALIVSGHQVVRGQLGAIDLVSLTVLGTSITAAVFSILAYDQSKDNSDAIDAINSQINQLPTSP